MKSAFAIFVTDIHGARPEFCTARASRADCIHWISREAKEKGIDRHCFYAQRYDSRGDPIGLPFR